MNQILVFRFLTGVAVGETIMFAWFGMVDYVALVGIVAMVLHTVTNYMENEQSKGMDT